MSTKMRVKPADGVNVKHPTTGRIICGEIDIESSKDVKRLLRFGDLIQVETKQTTVSKNKKEK